MGLYVGCDFRRLQSNTAEQLKKSPSSVSNDLLARGGISWKYGFLHFLIIILFLNLIAVLIMYYNGKPSEHPMFAQSKLHAKNYNNSWDPFQLGFKPEYRAETLVALVGFWWKRDEDGVSIFVLVHLLATLDNVDHSILLNWLWIFWWRALCCSVSSPSLVVSSSRGSLHLHPLTHEGPQSKTLASSV